MFKRKSKDHKYVKYHSLERNGINSCNYIDTEVGLAYFGALKHFVDLGL